MGLAVLEGDDLLYHKVWSLKQHRPKKKLAQVTRERLETLCELYPVDTVVVEKVPHDKLCTLDLLNAQTEAIRAWAQDTKRKHLEVPATTARRLLVLNGRATKRRTAEVVAQRFSHLSYLLRQRWKYRERYWFHLFDAIAVGLAYIQYPKQISNPTS